MLITDWKHAWKWLSVQSMTIAIVIQLAWSSLDEQQKSAINAKYITIAVLVFGIVGRLLDQNKRIVYGQCYYDNNDKCPVEDKCKKMWFDGVEYQHCSKLSNDAGRPVLIGPTVGKSTDKGEKQ